MDTVIVWVGLGIAILLAVYAVALIYALGTRGRG